MFPFFDRKRVFSFFVTSLIIVAVFSACGGDDDPLLKGLPLGTWVSSFGETFQITQSTLTNVFDGDTIYAGTIKNTRQTGDGEGYITIQITTASYNTVGNYYVLYWRDLKAGSVWLSAAAADYASKDDAEAACTVEKGSFAYGSACVKQ